MTNKKSILVLCGGQSTEHEISMISAKNVMAELDPSKYLVQAVYIDNAGRWYLIDDVKKCIDQDPASWLTQQQAIPVTWLPGALQGTLLALDDSDRTFSVDCIFPVLHGTNGEDGSMQGLLQLLNVPYVGADPLSSAMCMHKDITKQILAFNNIKVTPWKTINASQNIQGLYAQMAEDFSKILFVKPVSLGSSVGISRVTSEAEFIQAVKKGFRYDNRLLIEPFIEGREIECAVLGNENPVASLPGELVTQHAFYSYDAKYLDPQGARSIVPAELSEVLSKKIRQTAVDAFQALQCSGMARVDFFIQDENNIFINEINTIPGFTSISLYPKMWETSGLPYAELLDRLITLAFERHYNQQKLERVYLGARAASPSSAQYNDPAMSADS